LLDRKTRTGGSTLKFGEAAMDCPKLAFSLTIFSEVD